ncbi:MAG: nicotinate-nucleotide adenylyltransferase, partial [Clostridia bacterium]|nr:nicotinate-nucleotide adenylyltransferase [Clostridia bacterium]
STNLMKNIGIMGGTFDPPHVGHLMIAEYVREALDLEEVRFIPTGQIYYKDSSRTADPDDRLEMVRLAIAGNTRFTADAMEIEREGDTYTFETLEALKAAEPETAFTFIVGADSLDYMERWRHPERIFQCCSVAAVLRPGFSGEQMTEKKKELEQQFHARIEIVPAPLIRISSTELRQRLAEGKSVRYLIPEAVAEYIARHGLYRP